MKPAVASIANVALRTATLGTRFALVFILAKYLDAASVGFYGLFTAANGYALLCVGLDLYTYTTREIAKTGSEHRGTMLKGQATLVIALYVLFAPLVLIVLSRTQMPRNLIWWFLPILILEHLNQELYRLLIILSRQITASVLMFMRQGSWAIAAVGWMAISPSGRSLNIVMLLWASAGVIAAAAGLWTVRKMRLGGWREPIDWRWIKRGIVVSSTFLGATLSVRAVQTVDRYWLEALVGIKVVGAYVLFFGVASALSTFLDAAIFSFYYPRLVELAHKSKILEFRASVRRTALLTIAACLAFALASSTLIPVLLKWIGRDVYQSQIYFYYWIVAAMTSYSVGMVSHYALYARGYDRPIIVSHLASLAVFVTTTFALTTFSRVYAVPIGVFIAMTTVTIWKTATYLRISRNDARKSGTPNWKAA